MRHGKVLCPICGKLCASADNQARHLEEKHNNLTSPDKELLEKTDGKETLHG